MLRRTQHELTMPPMPRLASAPETTRQPHADHAADPVRAPSMFESMKPGVELCLPHIPGLFRPATTNHAGGFSLPSCWGARGSPWSLRCLTIGGPPKPPELSASRHITIERPPKRPIVQSRLPRLGKHRKRKERRVACMVNDASTKSFASNMSISTSENWRQPKYLDSQGKRELEPLLAVLREELTRCYSVKEVAKVARMANRIVSEGNASHFSTGGRLAYRFREASRAICNGSTFAALENHHLFAFRKVLKCEVRRREAELAGWGDKDAQDLALIPEMNEEDVRSPPMGSNMLGEQSLVSIHATSINAMDTRHSSLAFDEQSKQAHDESPPRPPTGSPRPGGLEEMMKRKTEFDIRLQETPSDDAVMLVTEEKKWTKVYGAMRDVSGIHHDDLASALQKVGFAKPDQKWIDEVFSKITKYIAMNEDEFLTFVRRYAEKQHTAFEEAFHECDADNSGTVEVDELVFLLRRFGVEPMKHVLDEVLTEVDEDGSGALNLQEFERVVESLRVREGFTKSEYEEFVGLFSKFDRDSSGEIDLEEIASVISWLGYAYDADKVQTIVKELDVDGSGLLNQSEFLMCMRQLRDAELHLVKDYLEASDPSQTGVEELQPVLARLGYSADQQALLESAADAEVVLASDSHVDLGDVWRTLVLWRKREGFTNAESEDLAEAFERYDKQGVGEISALEIGKVLRWLGYTPSFEVQQSLVARVDVDGSGKLSLPEFRKLLRMLQAKEMEYILEAFRRHDFEEKNVLHKDVAAMALADCGCIDAKGMAPQIPVYDLVYLDTDSCPEHPGNGGESPSRASIVAPKPEYVSLDVFLRIANEFNKAARRGFRDNSGFSSQEIIQMKECFADYDQDSSGDISSKELILLIEDMFPTMAHDSAVRPKLTKLMREIDADGNGSLDFPDFLRLMHQLQELTMQDRLAKEHKAIKETAFTQKEVEEFRELFLASGDGQGATIISFASLQRMLGTICPLGDANLRELIGIVRTIASKPNGESVDCPPSIDFPEFLRLMERLLEVDFAGIRARIGDKNA